MEILLLMHLAANLTGAACANVGGNLPVSPDLADNGVRAKNLHVWETFRVFYHALLGAAKDPQAWPMPETTAGNLLPGMIHQLTPLLQQPAVQDVFQRLLSLLPKPTQTPTAPLPDPK